jgi:hypothetical protein
MTRSLLTLVPILAAACAGYRAPETHAYPEAIASSGETIYFGHVFALDGDAADPTFIYERRVAGAGDRRVSTHITRGASSGEVAIAESATHSSDYRLVEYTLHTNQIGQTGTVRVDGERLSFHLADGDAAEDAVEEQTDPVVIGPTLVGYIARNLDALRAGETLPVRMAILDRLETIGFELAAIESTVEGTTIEMTPSSFLVRLAMDPIRFSFDARGNLVRLEGLVPPRVSDGDSWSEFEARVEYHYAVNEYR